jgi:hypothetical protein
LIVNEPQNFMSKYIGISRFDPELGYVPEEGFSAVITDANWQNKRVNMDQNGFRINDNKIDFVRDDRILAVGDSYTFGDEVSNNETWPSCLERTLRIEVDNAGVFGYGAAQSLKRGMLLEKKKPYRSFILSILVGEDFDRDGMMYRSGFAKPSLIRQPPTNEIRWSGTSDPMTLGTKYNPDRNPIGTFLYERSLIASYFISRMPSFRAATFFGDRLTKYHPLAAEKEEIIRWTVEALKNMQINNKLVLLQYGKAINEPHIQEERSRIIIALKNAKIDYVDTYD